jgi:hypothetical protein
MFNLRTDEECYHNIQLFSPAKPTVVRQTQTQEWMLRLNIRLCWKIKDFVLLEYRDWEIDEHKF